jgi:hypothetical protein
MSTWNESETFTHILMKIQCRFYEFSPAGRNFGTNCAHLTRDECTCSFIFLLLCKCLDLCFLLTSFFEPASMIRVQENENVTHSLD